MIGTGNNTDIRITLGTSDVEIYLGGEKVYPNTPTDYSRQYLTFDILENGNIGYTMSTNTLEYSKNGGATWTNGSPDTNIPVNAGDKVLLKFTNPVLYKENDTFFTTNGVCQFYTDCNFNVYGNIMSLIYGDDFNDNQKMSTLPVMQDNYGNTVDMNHFINLFYNCANLISAENLVLPATILKDECYNGMFQGCQSLTTAPSVLPAAYVTASSYAHMFSGCQNLVNAPQLPATSLGIECYKNMFQDCTSLTTAPQLPATTLANQCYDYMFSGCTSLTTAPQLPATTLANQCYYGMFSGCTSLTTAPQLPARTLTPSCYQRMFSGCTSLTTAPQLSATTLAHACYHSMFQDCTSLTTAPQLSTTTLANYCYYDMFQGCTSLTTAPALPATTLAEHCYDSMFSGCSKLNYIKAMFTTKPSETYTSNWVNGVASSGTFVKNSAATWNVSGDNGIPSGWTIQRASS